MHTRKCMCIFVRTILNYTKKFTRVESCGETISVEVIFISKPTRLVGVSFGNGTGITN